MVDSIDHGYLDSSSAHPFSVIKPLKTAKKQSKFTPDFDNEPFHQFIKKLNETYTEHEKLVFEGLASELQSFIESANAIYQPGVVTSFRYTQCAVVSLSVNVNELSCLFDLLFEKVDSLISIRLILKADEIKNITDFVKILQRDMLSYVFSSEDDVFREEMPFNYYGYAAEFWKANGDEKPILIVFEDFDCFNPTLLCDLFMLIHEYLEKLPILMICCQSTDILPLNLRLPSKATNNLSVGNFSFRPTKSFFDKLLDDICSDGDIPFKLGPRIITHLIEVYKLWDTSLRGAFRRVKLCAFEHFFSSSYSKLCCSANEIKSISSSLKDDELKEIRKLPSLKGVGFPKENDSAKSHLKQMLPDFLVQMENVLSELRFYHTLKDYLYPGQIFTFVEDTWIPFLSHTKFSASEDFENLRKQFLALDLRQVSNLMNNLTEEPSRSRSTIHSTLKNHCKDIDQKLKEEEDDASVTAVCKENKPSDPKGRTRGSNGIHSPRKTLPTARYINRSMMIIAAVNQLSKTPKRVNKFTEWKTGFLRILQEGLDKLPNPFHSPFHEIFFYDDIEQFKPLSLPTIRQDILETLDDPGSVLDCKCCSTLTPKAPEVTISYSIYRDLHRVANLKTCFEYFKDFIISKAETKVSPRKRTKKDPSILEREAFRKFISTIGDLEYIGLLRAHPRKADHIERLVWPTENLLNEEDDDSESDEVLSRDLKALSCR